MPSMASTTALILYSALHHSVSYYKHAKRLPYCLSVMSMYKAACLSQGPSDCMLALRADSHDGVQVMQNLSAEH